VPHLNVGMPTPASMVPLTAGNVCHRNGSGLSRARMMNTKIRTHVSGSEEPTWVFRASKSEMCWEGLTEGGVQCSTFMFPPHASPSHAESLVKGAITRHIKIMPYLISGRICSVESPPIGRMWTRESLDFGLITMLSLGPLYSHSLFVASASTGWGTLTWATTLP